MASFKDFFRRILNLFKSDRLDEEMMEEMQHHIEFQKQKNLEAGMSEREAYNAAVRQFGNQFVIQEKERESRTVYWVEQLYRDFRYSILSLWKNKGYAIAVVLTLGICLGANTAILSILYDLVLKPLPFESPDRVVEVFNVDNRLKPDEYRAGVGQFIDFNENADLFEGFAIAEPVLKAEGDGAASRLMEGLVLSANAFELFRVRPLLGRFFNESEVETGQVNTVVLSQSLWEREYQSSDEVLGKEIHFSGEGTYSIIGVAPRSLESLAERSDFFVPYIPRKRFNSVARNFIPTDLWARLKPGVSHEAGLAQLTALENRFLEEVALPDHRVHFEGIGHRVEMHRENSLAGALNLLQLGALLVLVVGSVNVFNLALSRARRRLSELSIRYSLGAGSFRLIKLLFAESAWLSLFSIILGLALAKVGLNLASAYLVVMDVASIPIGIDAFTLWVTIAFVIALAILVGTLPIGLMLRGGHLCTIDSSSRSVTMSRGSRALGAILVVSQVAMAFVLLAGAALMTKSLRNVMAVDPGFQPSQIIQARVAFTPNYYGDLNERVMITRSILESLRKIPGVGGVGFMEKEAVRPAKAINLHIQGVDYLSNDDPLPRGIQHLVSQDIADVFGLEILEGEPFLINSEGNASGLMVDEVFARRYFPNESAVGKRITTDVGALRSLGPKQTWFLITGVVSRANLEGLEYRDGLPVIYKPVDSGLAPNRHEMTFLVNTKRPVGEMFNEVRNALLSVDGALPILSISSMEASLDAGLAPRKGVTFLALCFGGFAIVIASIGLYGMQSYSVSQRITEFGIRIAVGAKAKEVFRLVLSEAISKVLIGTFLGLSVSLLLGRMISSFLFDVGYIDLGSFFAAFALLTTVSLVASYLPARRAMRVDPMEALRTE